MPCAPKCPAERALAGLDAVVPVSPVVNANHQIQGERTDQWQQDPGRGGHG